MTELQNKLLEIYINIKEICDKYDIRYWAIGGTCIGAVRHEGFIPWDNDIDIAMPDVDYYRFIEIAQKELLGTKYEVHSHLVGHMITRICDSTTTDIVQDEIRHPERYKGIYVDVMPFFGTPNNAKQRKIHCYLMGACYRLYKQKNSSFNDIRHLRGRLFWILLHPFLLLFPSDYFLNKWKKLGAKFQFDKSEYTSFLWSRFATKLILQTKWFSGYIEYPFETTEIRCPKDFDSYLQKQYGDYMTLPPKEEQENQGIGCFVDLDRPYKYYQKYGILKDK